MKQNNKTWLLIIAAAAITQSCSKDFLNKTPQSDYTTASFYKTANDAEKANRDFLAKHWSHLFDLPVTS